MTNLSDDWGAYYHICDLCGKRYHASGADTCACVMCEECSEVKPPDEYTLDEYKEMCDSCVEKSYDPRDEWDLADEKYQEWKDNPEDRDRYDD